MQIDALLIRLIEKLLLALGPVAEGQRTGVFSEPIASWSNRDVLDFIERIRTATGDEYMGLGASSCPVGISNYIIELCSRCGDLREAISFSFRLLNMVSDAIHFELQEEDDQATILIRQASGGCDNEHVLSDWHMIIWHKLPQWLIGETIWLEKTEFDHPLDDHYSCYTSMFGNDCVFNSDACRLCFSRSYLDRRVTMSREEASLLRATTPGYFSSSEILSTSWKEKVSKILRSEIAGGHQLSSLQELAGEFAISTQTLRRRLKDEKTSYRELKLAARREAALDSLAAGGGRLGEASLAAGFMETNSFERALRAQGARGKDLRSAVDNWLQSGE